MKRIILILSVLYCINGFGQGYFPDSNSIWNVFVECPNTLEDQVYGLSGDTTINSIDYSKVYLLTDTIIDSVDRLIGCVRSDGGKVFFLPAMGNSPEFLLYDFSLSVDDTIKHNAKVRLLDGSKTISFDTANFASVITSKRIESGDTIFDLSVGTYDEVFGFNFMYSDQWITGIGSLKGLFWHLYEPPLSCEGENKLKCLKSNDSIVYLNDSRCNTCFCAYITTNDEMVNKNESSNIQVYPNPSTKTVLVEIDNGEGINYLEVFDQQGVSIIKEQAHSRMQVDLLSGVYFFNFITDKNCISKKVVVKR